MKYINVYIIDSSSKDSSVLNKTLHLFSPVIKIIGSQNNSITNVDFLITKKVNILFINLDLVSNFDTQTQEKLLQNNIQIIALIDTEKKALSAFKHNAIYCIKKPYTLESISLAINKVFTNLYLTTT